MCARAGRGVCLRVYRVRDSASPSIRCKTHICVSLITHAHTRTRANEPTLAIRVTCNTQMSLRKSCMGLCAHRGRGVCRVRASATYCVKDTHMFVCIQACNGSAFCNAHSHITHFLMEFKVHIGHGSRSPATCL